MSDCCGELLAEGVGYFLVSSGQSIIEADLLVGGNSWLLSGRPGDEPPKSSCVLCLLAGLHFAPSTLPIAFDD